MKLLKILLLLFLMSLSPLAAEEKDSPEDPDLSGTWKVILSNKLTRRQLTFQVEDQDGRYRGHMMEVGKSALPLTGRLKSKGKKFFFWGRTTDRSGRSFEYEFRGKVEGEPGDIKLVGRSEFFGKRYDIIGTRPEKK